MLGEEGRLILVKRIQILWSLEVLPAPPDCTHSLLRLPASCIPIPQGPFPQPLSGPLKRKKKLSAAPKDLGDEESIPQSFLSGSKNSVLSWICKEGFSYVAAPALHVRHLSSKPSYAGVTTIFLSPSPLGCMAWTVC